MPDNDQGATEVLAPKHWTLFFDGGSNGNPGPSAGAAVLFTPLGQRLCASRYLDHATNNQAEYAGLLCGLELAHQANADQLTVHGDSLLVVNQFNGTWKAKDAALITNLAEARRLAENFQDVKISWIPREENAEADLEVRRCLKAHVLPQTPVEAESSASSESSPEEDIPQRYREGKFAALNLKEPGHVSFQELAGIKVGGSDEFSRKKREVLLELLASDGSAAVAAIDDILTSGRPKVAERLVKNHQEKLALTALRWTARGLRPEHAAQKVLVDLELSLNASSSRSKGRR